MKIVPRSAAPATQERSIGSLLADVRAARDRMSASNPHRAVLEQCGVALAELAQRLHEAEMSRRQLQQIASGVARDIVAILAMCPSSPMNGIEAGALRHAAEGWEEALTSIDGVTSA